MKVVVGRKESGRRIILHSALALRRRIAGNIAIWHCWRSSILQGRIGYRLFLGTGILVRGQGLVLRLVVGTSGTRVVHRRIFRSSFSSRCCCSSRSRAMSLGRRLVRRRR